MIVCDHLGGFDMLWMNTVTVKLPKLVLVIMIQEYSMTIEMAIMIGDKQ